MNRRGIDTKDAIAAALASYERLYRLIEDRREWFANQANATHEGTLTAFYVLGRFCLDQQGNVVKLRSGTFSESQLSRLEPVMSEPEFLDFCQAEGISIAGAFDVLVASCGSCGEGCCSTAETMVAPAPRARCEVCGSAWTAMGLGDHVMDGVQDDIELNLYVGRTFRYALEVMRGSGIVIDLPGVVRNGETLALVEGEPEPLLEGLPSLNSDDTVKAGDVLLFVRPGWYHRSCHAKMCGLERPVVAVVDQEGDGEDGSQD